MAQTKDDATETTPGTPVGKDELIAALESFRSVPTRPLTPDQQNVIAWHQRLKDVLAGPTK